MLAGHDVERRNGKESAADDEENGVKHGGLRSGQHGEISIRQWPVTLRDSSESLLRLAVISSDAHIKSRALGGGAA